LQKDDISFRKRGNTLIPYHYSDVLLTFVKAKWTLAKFATGGVVIGTILLFGFLELNPSVGNAIGTRSAGSLAADNELLR
jgi:hypothetical protein